MISKANNQDDRLREQWNHQEIPFKFKKRRSHQDNKTLISGVIIEESKLKSDTIGQQTLKH